MCTVYVVSTLLSLFVMKVDNLTSAFGSSKSKRAMASRKKNKVTGQSLENSVGTAVDAAVGSMDVTDLAGGWS